MKKSEPDNPALMILAFNHFTALLCGLLTAIFSPYVLHAEAVTAAADPIIRAEIPAFLFRGELKTG